MRQNITEKLRGKRQELLDAASLDLIYEAKIVNNLASTCSTIRITSACDRLRPGAGTPGCSATPAAATPTATAAKVVSPSDGNSRASRQEVSRGWTKPKAGVILAFPRSHLLCALGETEGRMGRKCFFVYPMFISPTARRTFCAAHRSRLIRVSTSVW